MQLSHKRHGDSAATSVSTDGEGGGESSEQNSSRLLELVKVLRKDKELYETKWASKDTPSSSQFSINFSVRFTNFSMVLTVNASVFITFLTIRSV